MIKSSKFYIEVQTNPKIFSGTESQKETEHMTCAWNMIILFMSNFVLWFLERDKTNDDHVRYRQKSRLRKKKTQTHHHDNICGVKDQSTESTNHHLVSEVRWSLWDWPEEEIRLKENDQNRKGRRRIQYHTHTHSLRISGSV